MNTHLNEMSALSNAHAYIEEELVIRHRVVAVLYPEIREPHEPTADRLR